MWDPTKWVTCSELIHSTTSLSAAKLAPFPGSPRARTKNRRGEPGRIDHVKNVIGREDLITCGRTNELATLYGQSAVAIALWPTEWD